MWASDRPGGPNFLRPGGLKLDRPIHTEMCVVRDPVFFDDLDLNKGSGVADHAATCSDGGALALD
jgi:hypothetical protein